MVKHWQKYECAKRKKRKKNSVVFGQFKKTYEEKRMPLKGSGQSYYVAKVGLAKEAF